MVKYGLALSSEEHSPLDLVKYGRSAEDAGFDFVSVSDHYHPWIEFQGHSPFVWNVIGGLANATERIQVGTGVTCPIMRIHPAVIAQAAATSAAMLPGRFYFGIGTGEALNEHILGDHWPPATIRLEMLAEAVEIIRLLWQGDEASYWGEYFTVENARIYTLPAKLPPIYMAAGGQGAVELAGEIADGLIMTSPDEKMVKRFRESGGEGKPVMGQMTLCYAESEDEALETAYQWWPNTILPPALLADLPTPDHFEQAVKLVRKENIQQDLTLGPDPNKHLEKIHKYLDAGFTHLYFHQIGQQQEEFIRYFHELIKPNMEK